jgi:acyl-CoA ligase (AMP-forming) (exosortase A-associated)
MTGLVFDALVASGLRDPHAEALVYQERRLDYATLNAEVARFARALAQVDGIGAGRGERLAIYLEKRIESVVAMFGASMAGAVFVPVNPLLKAAQVVHILNDCSVRVLVTSAQRLASLGDLAAQCPALETIILTDDAPPSALAVRESQGTGAAIPALAAIPTRSTDSGADRRRAPSIVRWRELDEPCADRSSMNDGHAGQRQRAATIDGDVAAILYTSGSTGRPKGVVLSHRNMVAGAASVSAYLENHAGDRLLAVLPLSFDYGMSQLTTAFSCGAAVVLINHLFPRDIVRAVESERITGLAAVPALWMQLAQLDWPAGHKLRYLTNSGGAMPRATVDSLRARLPRTRIFLMYGLTEAFRSTYLPPEELDRRPGSMGRAIPNAEILVARADGSLCDDDEAGELVHRGVLVSLGYWNDAQKTAERFRPAPARHPELVLPDMAVWSGDIVRRDAEGFLYFIGRNDEMIKLSGYRVSPGEIEEIVLACQDVAEAVAFGVPHPQHGQAIVVVAVPAGGADADAFEKTLLAACRQQLPAYMVPARIVVSAILPRNPNGKIDRRSLQSSYADTFDRPAGPPSASAPVSTSPTIGP